MNQRETPDTPTRVRLAAAVTGVIEAGSRVVFTREDQVDTFVEPVYRDIARALAQGAASESWRSLETSWGGAWREALVELLARGLIREDDAQSSRGVEAFWEGLRAKGPDRLTVAARNLCGAAGELALRAIVASGFAIEADADLLLVLADDYLNPRLEELDHAGRAWLLARPVGQTILLGPLFAPGKPLCWTCLSHSLRRNRWELAALAPEGARDAVRQPAAAAFPASILAAAGMVATTAAAWLAGRADLAPGDRFLSLDVRDWRREWHWARPRRGCPRCAAGADAAVDLEHLVSPLTGVASAVSVTTAPVLGHFHALGSCTPPAPMGGSRAWIRPFAVSGRGSSPEAARHAAVAEAAERYSAIWQGDEPMRRAAIEEIGGVAPDRLLLFSATQYASAAEWNRREREMHWIPERLDPERPIGWVEARSLFDGSPRWVPAGYCYLWYPFRDEPRYCAPDSNGCAAGRTIEEAIFGGLMELAERDAVAIWWYNRAPRPCVDPDSPELPELRLAARELERGGRRLALLDVTTDLGIPAYVATAPALDGSELVFAAAAHWSPGVAARKALGELSQMIRWNVDGPGEAFGAWLRTATLSSDPHFAPRGKCALRPEPGERDPGACLAASAERLRLAGVDACWLDLTRGEAGVPAARAIAPGLRHIRARFAPGRLYDVPVSLGWVAQRKREAELNPVACMT